MAFKVGSNTVVDNSRNITSGTANGTAAAPTGFLNSGGTDISQLIRFTTYTDDYGNCRGYLPTGNCGGNTLYQVPNGNWWTWGVTGISTSLCGNPSSYNGTLTGTYYTVSVAYVYDAYYELYNRIRGSEQHRGYSHCNCNSGVNSVGNCYSACNCNCDCVCNC
jgi:hypothetical protein